MEINMKKPVVELSDCTLCGCCVEVCPTVFCINEADFLEVIELDQYPEDEVTARPGIYWQARVTGLQIWPDKSWVVQLQSPALQFGVSW